MKLYENESYLRQYTTTITECERVPEGVWVTFEDTIFFPEEGGQYADTGVIEAGGISYEISDGKLEDGRVKHFIRTDDDIKAGTEVFCTLDWEKRFMRMQQHSGEHIITGMIHNNFGYNNVGFHLSDDSPVTLDVDGTLSAEQVSKMELLANEIIYRDLPIRDTYPTKEELKSIEYRSKIEIEGQVRLISVGNEGEEEDICACCAPHVSSAGQVGIIKVIYHQNYKGGTRLGILCGKRALEYIQNEHDMMVRLAGMFSTSTDNVQNCVEKQSGELSDAKYRIAQLAEGELMRRIEAMPAAENCCLIINDEISANISPVTIKNCYNKMADTFTGYVGVFIGCDEDGYRFNAGSKTLDSRVLMGKLKDELKASGGGSQEMVQGKVSAAKEQIEAFFRGLRN